MSTPNPFLKRGDGVGKPRKRGSPVRQKEEQLKRNCAEQKTRRVFYGEEESLAQDIAQAEAELRKLQERDPEGFARLQQDADRNYAEIMKKIQERNLMPVAEAETLPD